MRIYAAIAVLVAVANAAPAQELHLMAQAIPLITRADPTATRRALTEAYLTQPMVMARVTLGDFRAAATLNLEGLTLQRGELNTGAYGEGYVDRRHPHAYIHEIMGGFSRSSGTVAASLYAGRGFVPFGSDDPMTRPIEKYPVNHHLAQILERLVAVAGVRAGPLLAEAAAFNGDEPVAPQSSPEFRRFGDSWAGRLTVVPVATVELSASFASVASPEQPSGHGLDQRKASVVARWSAPSAPGSPYLLGEWARSREYEDARIITTLSSVLVEGSVCRAGVVLAGRAERTDRPEEESLFDPFRTPRPASDLNNIGVSRWTTLTAALAAPTWRTGALAGRPFVEIARVRVQPGNPPGLFQPDARYGTRRMWMYSVGVRLRVGSMHDRMGRYGVASADAVPMGQMGTMTHEHGSEMNPAHQSSSNQCTL